MWPFGPLVFAVMSVFPVLENIENAKRKVTFIMDKYGNGLVETNPLIAKKLTKILSMMREYMRSFDFQVLGQTRCSVGLPAF